MMVAMMLLAAQIALAPCPSSLACTAVPALITQPTAPPVAVVADPARPARWYVATNLVALGAFESWALATEHDTVSQWTQRESRDHHVIRYVGIPLMALLTWHLFFGFPW